MRIPFFNEAMEQPTMHWEGGGAPNKCKRKTVPFCGVSHKISRTQLLCVW